MVLTKYGVKAVFIAIGASCVALLAEPCMAQLLRPSLPIHFDDRDPSSDISPVAGTATGIAVAAVAIDQATPPPLPSRSAAAAQSPQPLNQNSGQQNSGQRLIEANASQARPGRKNYAPEQRPISQISIDVSSKSKGSSSIRPESVAGTAPEELPAVMAATANEMYLGWMATAERTSEQFAYQPLYFEEVNLERYGRSAGFWQPAVSTTRFFATVPLLPYKIAAHSPHRPYYWNWPYAAGTCAPRVRETFPLHPKAALVEAGVLTGAAFLIP